MDKSLPSNEESPTPRRYLRRNFSIQAIQSFENLVALANDQEKLKDAKKMVWRDRGEPAVELTTIRDCLMHAIRGGLIVGLGAGTLAFAIRSGFNLFVLLFRIWKLPRGFRLLFFKRAMFGEDSFRFGAMIGTFVSLYKYILNALPLLNFKLTLPFLSPPTHAATFDQDDNIEANADAVLEIQALRTNRRLSTQAQAHQEWVRKRTKRWHAIVAGAVAGGLGLLFEKKRRRVTIAQQLFVRGLQGSYNEFTTRHGIQVPFGAVILFAVCSGQIIYAFLLRPDTIPPGYNDWIQRASKVLPETIRINKTLVREGHMDLEDMEAVLKWKGIHPEVEPLLIEELQRARAFGDFGPHFASCAVVHPWLPSCKSVPVDRFVSVFKWMFPIYGALHFIPMILFKRHKFLKEPGWMLLRALTGTARSSTFLGTFVIIYQTYFCLKHNLHLYLISPKAPVKFPKFVTDLLIGKLSFWLGGLLSGVSLFIEAKHRRPELAMYVLPKGLESAWKIGRGKGFVVGPRKYGEAILCAFAMGMVMNAYQHNPQHLSGLVRRILYQFIGPN